MINQLTGIRFLAAAVVVFVHAGNLAAGKDMGFSVYAANAVSLFFVLSGFILAIVYDDRMDSAGSWYRFYVARFARIWPVHIACLVFAFFVLSNLNEIRWNDTVLRNLAINCTLTHSWLPIRKLAYWFNGPSWSISTEFAFYLVFPFVLPLFQRRKWLALGASVIFGVASVAMLDAATHSGFVQRNEALYFTYVNPIFRVFEFLLGIFAGQIYLRKQAKFTTTVSTICELTCITLMLVAISIVANANFADLIDGVELTSADAWLKNGAAMAPIYALLLVVLAKSSGPISRLLSHPASIYLGEISFAFYLVQQPVIAWIKHQSAELLLSPSLLFLTVIVFALTGAVFLHGFIEAPARSFISNLMTKRKFRVEFKQVIDSVLSPVVWLSMVGSFFLGTALLSEIKIQTETVFRDRVALLWNIDAGDAVRSVEFKDQAILKSATASEGESDLIIRILWEKLPNWDHQRFLHITDEAGEIIAQLPPEEKLFADASVGEFVFDEIIIPKSSLEEATNVGIGFFKKGIGTAPVLTEGGVHTGMNGRRLELVKLAEGKASLQFK